MIQLQTKRLILRPWKIEDLEPFARLNADPKVMEKIRMHCNEKDTFDHSNRPENHPLRSHVLYRLKKQDRVLI